MFFFEKKTREPPTLGYARFGEPLYTKKIFVELRGKISRKLCCGTSTHNDFLPCRKSVICYSHTQTKPYLKAIIQQTKYNPP